MTRLSYIVIAALFLLVSMVPATLRLQAQADLARYNVDELSPADAGAALFAFYDWGGLNSATLRTNAVPWKLAEAALALHHVDGDVDAAVALSAAEIFRPFGFYVPDSIANWPSAAATPVINGPLGIVRGMSGGFTPASVEISNIGCAACHSSLVYGSDGIADLTQVWLGGSNSSLNLDAYTSALFDALLTYGDTQILIDVMASRFPHMTSRERATLRFVLLPAVLKELRTRDTATGRLLPFEPSHIGATNGYDALRLQIGLIGQSDGVAQQYFTSIPSLAGRDWRSRFLSNGVYTAAGVDHTATVTRGDLTDARRAAQAQIVSYFLVPSMGVTPQVAIEQHAPAQNVMDWVAQSAAQPYPAPIDAAQAALGRDIYSAECAACHGTYDASLIAPALVSFPNWEGDVGTHAGPPLALVEQVAQAVNASEYQSYLVARPTTLRSAPPLSGLWASAPYLANGSVPTLWHLMRPALRPQTFGIGGHRLDLDRVGIDLSPPQDYQPWSISGVFDSRIEGKSNAGHTIGFEGLSEAEKTALIEYLKLL